MSREAFVLKNFRPESLAMIKTANTIIDRYLKAGLRLSARQLYYVFVAHHGLPNVERSYKNLCSLISQARLAGLIDWDAIEDRGREPDRPQQWPDIPALVEAAVRAFRLPRWAGQDAYVELWVEKQALAGVLAPLASEFHATLMVNKGYSSSSAMYEASKRLLPHQDDGRSVVILYLGDHDPSGEDMVRDIRDRLVTFGVDQIEVEKLALTMAQIKEFNPPPNPAKITDPRAADYIAKHGAHSWEVDALNPETLASIIREGFERHVDDKKMAAIVRQESKEKARLKKVIAAADWTSIT